MQLFLDCLPCLLRQVLEAARTASGDERTQAGIMAEAIPTIARHEDYGCAPALALAMHEIVKRHTAEADPYRKIKDQHLAAALRLEPVLAEFTGSGPDRLLRALKVSAIGNMMDSAHYTDLDIEACIAAELDKSFARCDLEAFTDDLKLAKNVLIIGDNAGETVFDKTLARELARKHAVTFAVRGQPIINDATVEDARFAGMGSHAAVVSTGCPAPGTILAACDEDFRELFDQADLVISKGQGNFEALSDPPRRIYFLLKAKCHRVATALEVEMGDYVFRASS